MTITYTKMTITYTKMTITYTKMTITYTKMTIYYIHQNDNYIHQNENIKDIKGKEALFLRKPKMWKAFTCSVKKLSTHNSQ